ncbi:hypothetical protein [Mycetocola saprophilus]|uniref:preprotein translocase subunit SecA n=1 Tax=Mycetocola saprophilus TaxID=76636 RepID=UPI0009DDBC1A|nr:hypothetical protein [Mycetocola saprophilus]
MRIQAIAELRARLSSDGPVSSARIYLNLARDAARWEQKLRDTDHQVFHEQALGRFTRGHELSTGVSGFELAVLREVARRVLGVRASEGQLAATAAMVAGVSVELDTGEGKTLVGAFTACAMFARGHSVHILTTNDYLAARDSGSMVALFRFLRVGSAHISSLTPHRERADAYLKDVVYAPLHEVGYDLLRDRVAERVEDRVRPVCDAVILDEADALIIDAGASPLVIARDDATPMSLIHDVTAVINDLRDVVHYRIAPDKTSVVLTEQGVHEIETRLRVPNLYRDDARDILAYVHAALSAAALLERGRDYLVRDGRIELINTSLGRIAHQHRYPDGLQLAVESKEGVPLSRTGTVLDAISVHGIISAYTRPVGMSGTLRLVSLDLMDHYGMPVTRMEPEKAVARIDQPDLIFRTGNEQLEACVRMVKLALERGQPVLIGTASIPDSEWLGGRLRAVGLTPVVLNARNDSEEASVIGQAGKEGRLTVSTQISGRGADIVLGGGDPEERQRVLEHGGLLVIALTRYQSRRIDAQLRGRAGRRGDPGHTRAILSLEDPQVQGFAPKSLLSRAEADGESAGGRAGRIAIVAAQRASEYRHLDRHRDVIAYGKLLAEQRAVILLVREELLAGSCEAFDRYVARTAANNSEHFTHGPVDPRVLLRCVDLEWSAYLAEVSIIRDSAHLFALEGKSPLAQYNLILGGMFERYWESVRERTTRAHAEISNGYGTTYSGPPSTDPSIWTYLLESDPYGSTLGRFITNLRARGARRATDRSDR